MSEQPGATSLIGGEISNGNADWVGKFVINLPCFAYMTQAEVDFCCRDCK
jgi:UDP-2-acetamido-2-deoxy-ribo-hexuluronate aminotransferase